MPIKKAYIPDQLRVHIVEEARNRCGYCLRSEELMGMPMTIDHIIPESVGGRTEKDNLWLACTRCNQYKGAQTEAFDTLTQKTVLLFQPRLQIWVEHFEWSQGGTEIVGKTATGRATVKALRLNNAKIVVTRRLWVSAGWWPPQD